MNTFDANVWIDNWWVVALRGIAAITFGIVTLMAPGLTLLAFVIAFGAYVLADGVLALVTAARRRAPARPWWLLVLEGVAGIGAGVMTFLWPLALLYVIAAWALVTGVFAVVTSIRLRKSLRGEWLLALSGIASIALGVVLVLFPGPGALGLVLWLGVYAEIAGVLWLALGLRLRAWGRSQTLANSLGVMRGPPVPAHGTPRG